MDVTRVKWHFRFDGIKQKFTIGKLLHQEMLSKKLLLLFTVLAFIVTNVYCEHFVDVKLIKEIANKDYPNFTKSPDTWILAYMKIGGAVFVECNIKFKEDTNNCATGSVSFLEGVGTVNVCNNQEKFIFHSDVNSMSIELKLANNNEAKIKCNVKPMEYGRPFKYEEKPNNKEQIPQINPEPLKKITEEIKIEDNNINRDINGYIVPDLNNKYKFRCAKNRNILLRCQMMVDAPFQPKRCDGFRFRVDTGSRVRWQCQTDKSFNYISEKDQMDVTITSGKFAKGFVKCEIKTVQPVKHSNYKNIPSEEIDSSEFGLKAKHGVKKTTCECGWTNKETRRILFGNYAGKHEFPWAVSLHIRYSKFHFCGGSIITPYHVLTAAHCIGEKKPSDILVVMGSNNRTDTTLSSEVSAIYEHDFNTETHVNDIAILVLKKKIEYTEFVGPICLPTKDPKIIHQYVTAMGWGRVHKSELEYKDLTILKKTNLRIVDIASCSIDWNFHWEIDVPTVFCTWSNHSDTCMGDSGGPVTWHDPETNRYTLIGLPSLGDGCVMRIPSVHTAVHVFYDWIQNTIKNSAHPDEMTCSKID